MKILNNKILFVVAALASLFVLACKKEFNPDFNLPRQFKPGDITVTAGEVEARLQWNPSLFTQGKDVTYTVEISQDSLFSGMPVHTRVVDTSFAIITDAELQINTFYFARVKANAKNETAESGWVTSGRFRITGEQIFFAVNDAELTDSSVILKWKPSPGLTKIVLTPAGGTAMEITLTAADLAANEKEIKGLTQLKSYTAEIFRGTLKKGAVTFTTKEKSIFTQILQPGADIVAAIENAPNGAVIGLQPGTYNALDAANAYVNFNIVQKEITLQSVSGNPLNTKVNFKAIVLKGTGAGIKVSGIDFDGTAGAAAYFIDFTGVNADAEQASYETVTVENSIVHSTASSLIRGNRGANNAYKIDSIILKGSIFYDNGTGGFDYILLDKMEFRALEITNSTFYNSGRRLISWATNITSPQKPVITIDHVTINNIGYGGRDYLLLDANANPIDFTLKNSIVANSPKPGQTVGNNLLRASAASSIVRITNTNMFKLSNGAATPAALIIPAYVVQAGNLSVDLEWTAATTLFTLPASSPVRTASDTGGPIGDPRWY